MTGRAKELLPEHDEGPDWGPEPDELEMLEADADLAARRLAEAKARRALEERK